MSLNPNISALIAENNIDEALAEMEKYVESHPGDAEALFEQGRLYWRMGMRPKAISSYAHAAEIDPEGPASTALEQARDIEDFFNPDLLNP